MSKQRVKLTEMKSCDPAYVSLVKRGANRIPFRIVKSGEKDMAIDLSSIFKREKRVQKQEEAAAPVSASVIAFVVEKSEDMTGVQKALTDAGYSVEKAEDQPDGSVAFRQTDDGLEEGAVVRVSDNMVAVVKDLKDVPDFGQIAVEGSEDKYLAGSDLACSVLKEALDAALLSDQPLEGVQKSIKEFGQYVEGLVALPQAIFKADFAFGESVKAAAVAKAAEAEEVEKAAKKKPAEGSSEEEAAESLAAESAEGKAGKGDAKKADEIDVDDKIAKALEASNANLMTALGDLIAKAMEPVTNSVAALDAQVKEVATKAEKVEKTVSTTVVAGARVGDEPAVPVQKEEEDQDPRRGVFDTALIRKRQRNANR